MDRNLNKISLSLLKLYWTFSPSFEGWQKTISYFRKGESVIDFIIVNHFIVMQGEIADILEPKFSWIGRVTSPHIIK